MHYACLLSEGGMRINLCEQFDIKEDIHKHAFKACEQKNVVGKQSKNSNNQKERCIIIA